MLSQLLSLSPDSIIIAGCPRCYSTDGKVTAHRERSQPEDKTTAITLTLCYLSDMETDSEITCSTAWYYVLKPLPGGVIREVGEQTSELSCYFEQKLLSFVHFIRLRKCNNLLSETQHAK